MDRGQMLGGMSIRGIGVGGMDVVAISCLSGLGGEVYLDTCPGGGGGVLPMMTSVLCSAV